jgi:hypothetical protein
MGANHRPPGWAPQRLMDDLSKTDALDLAWMLAVRLNDGDPIEILADEAAALARQVPAFKTAAKRLQALHKQVQAGHADRCRTIKRRDNGYLPPGWKRCQGGWKCSPECKAGLAEGK